MNWRKLLKWLASYPLDRVRRNIYLRSLPPREPTELEMVIKQFYNSVLLDSARQSLHRDLGVKPRTMEWRRHGFLVDGQEVEP